MPSARRNYLMRQLFTPVLAGVFFCARNADNSGIISINRILSQGLALRLALQIAGQNCSGMIGAGGSHGVPLNSLASDRIN